MNLSFNVCFYLQNPDNNGKTKPLDLFGKLLFVCLFSPCVFREHNEIITGWAWGEGSVRGI